MFVGTELEIKRATNQVLDERRNVEVVNKANEAAMQKAVSRLYLATNELAKLCSTK